ncbi:sensor histidine kinase [Saccharopolyspora sp. MS10]|uniref:sensor histidine kinase n=1 Tax=Saccharopolyspora sp. MS10 TaxID=3385973 RepID=UPI00399F3664
MTRVLGDRPLPGAEKFETFARWCTYSAVALPITTFLGSALLVRGPIAVAPLPQAVVFGLVLALTGGSIVVSRWSIDSAIGVERALPVGVVAGWSLLLVAIVVAAPSVPLPGMQLTVVAAVASVAASLVPALGAGRAALLNAVALVATVLLAGFSDIPALVAALIVISFALWASWSNAWMLRVLIELQAAHEDRATLALAEERLRISRDLHDVLGQTLATIAVKSSLASELVDRGHSERAAAEIAAIRRIAEQAGTEARRVVRGEHRTTWHDEVAGARSLLESAGIGCTVIGDPVPEGCAEPLGWVVREAVTNLLRHSAATQVTIASSHGDGKVLLTITNDGVADRRSTGAGSGLDSLSKRLGALGGRLTPQRDGTWFVLDAEVPAPQEEPA